MKLLTFMHNGQEQVGVLSQNGQGVIPLKEMGYSFAGMNELIERATKQELADIAKQAVQKDEKAVCLKEVGKMAAIPRPRQDVLCLGINYMDHAEESARFKAEAFGGERPYAVYFSKRVSEAAGDGETIPNYQEIEPNIDYEAELGVIIGKDAKNVAKEDAQQYIFGYTVINDMSARTLQTRHKQWYFGKSLDKYCVIGPWIVTADEIAFPPQLDICSKVNGELRQHSNTRLMIFDIAHVIHELSQGMTLKAGTIIATGTPAGVGMGFVPPKFLRPGDVVACEIENIGSITNTIA